eukprot:CAMPEP_0174826214 /NCGR_PEP_ID=MMETSP1107-20130205/43677_1 /TAXON_ID=36770 /ORGANISM="Paraphysomonas vestita, Strain GFlagA" /LENGTH=100 /DNA_ID=CAMNT_0016058887 /DNA_START=2103 /DNA_END=2405 /DNA_ORIENTATION=-
MTSMTNNLLKGVNEMISNYKNTNQTIHLIHPISQYNINNNNNNSNIYSNDLPPEDRYLDVVYDDLPPPPPGDSDDDFDSPPPGDSDDDDFDLPPPDDEFW